jgi:hypothetical protein
MVQEKLHERCANLQLDALISMTERSAGAEGRRAGGGCGAFGRRDAAV